jgi:hypothetical protein
MQSESLLSGFAETPPIMERSSKIAQVECNQSSLSGFAETPPIMERSSKIAFCLSESKGTSISD